MIRARERTLAAWRRHAVAWRRQARVPLAALLLAQAPALADVDEQKRPAQDAAPEFELRALLEPGTRGATGVDPAVMLSLEHGMRYLAQRQAEQEDGSFPQDDKAEFVPVAVTALASLAWMAAGNEPGRGPYGNEVASAIDYLVRNANVVETSAEYGYITDGGTGRIHAHGFATLALSQAWSMSPRSVRGKKIASVLEAGVRLIENAQVHEGGWYYEPYRTLQHENSTTICVVQALRAARNAGIRVDPAVIANAVDYVKRTQNPDGSFRYGLEHDDATVAITAAAVATLNATGEYAGKPITSGMQWMLARLDLRSEAEGSGDQKRIYELRSKFPYYERLYVAQALWQNPDPRLFERWWAEEQKRIVADQETDGSWPSSRWGSSYATAVNCLVLALPLGVLPIFQR